MYLHHIGYVVKSISKYENNLLFEEKINEVYDSVQNSKIAVYKNYSQCLLEIIEPVNENAYTFNFLNKYGNNYHHVCYAIKDINQMFSFAEKYKMIKILGPIPALIFNNKEVYFFFTRNKGIIEFILE